MFDCLRLAYDNASTHHLVGHVPEDLSQSVLGLGLSDVGWIDRWTQW